MKSTFWLFSIALLFVFNISKAQKTTQEEYNYITKGYKVQMESGLDMKKGYFFKDLGTFGVKMGVENRDCTFKALHREGNDTPCAILMLYNRTDIKEGMKYYVCIPSKDADASIWQQTLDFISSNFKDSNAMMQTVIYALMKFGSQEACSPK